MSTRFVTICDLCGKEPQKSCSRIALAHGGAFVDVCGECQDTATARAVMTAIVDAEKQAPLKPRRGFDMAQLQSTAGLDAYTTGS